MQTMNATLTKIYKSAARWPLDATKLNNATFALYSKNVCKAP